jgi:hypothetical protein
MNEVGECPRCKLQAIEFERDAMARDALDPYAATCVRAATRNSGSDRRVFRLEGGTATVGTWTLWTLQARKVASAGGNVRGNDNRKAHAQGGNTVKRTSFVLVILAAMLVSGCSGPSTTPGGSNPTPLTTRLMAGIAANLAPQPSEALATPTKWEYKLVDFGLAPLEQQDWWSGDGNTTFNQLGQEGWEYVDNILAGKVIAVFKRPMK